MVRARWGAVAAVLGLCLMAAQAGAGGGTSSEEVPQHRTQSTVIIRTTTADAPVQVNVDIGMQVRPGARCSSPYPGACKGATYHPCFNLDDTDYAGCQLYTLYHVFDPDYRLDQGLPISSADTARAGRVVEHGWARKVTTVALEVYAADAKAEYGDVRLDITAVPYAVGDTAYTDLIGHINLPKAGDKGTSVIDGQAIGPDGRPMKPGSFKFDVFGHKNTGRPTGLLGEGGFMEYGFGRGGVVPGRRDGYYTTRALYDGYYDIHVQRRGASYLCGVDVRNGRLRFDLDFRRDRLGHPGCRPMRPLVRTVPG